jgi:N-acetyl-anhydromuramyl-L-alanine amidase AmpD
MHSEFETDKFPVVKAKFFRDVVERRPVRLVVIHSMEAPETDKTAENVARFFQNPGKLNGKDRKVSAHLCIDNNSIVQCVLDNDVAFAAPGVNNDGIHLELAGFARQTREQWLDPFGMLLLDQAANAAAQYCLKYDIPIKHLTNEELADKKKRGLVGHMQASAVFQGGQGHTDPGKGFPWDHFITRVEHFHAERLKMFSSL